MGSQAKEWGELASVFLVIGSMGPIILWWKNRQLKDVGEDVRAYVNQSMRNQVRSFLAVWLVVLLFFLGWIILALFNVHPLGRPVDLFWPLFGACHLLWWPFAVPIVNGIRLLLEESGTLPRPQPSEAVRSAPLKPRRMRDYMPPYGYTMVVTLAVGGPIAIFVWYLWHPPGESGQIFHATQFALSGLGVLAICLIVMRFILVQRLPAGDCMDVSQAEVERKYRIRSTYWLMIVISLFMYGSALLGLEVAHGTLPESTANLIWRALSGASGFAAGGVGIASDLRIRRLRKDKSTKASLGITPSE